MIVIRVDDFDVLVPLLESFETRPDGIGGVPLDNDELKRGVALLEELCDGFWERRVPFVWHHDDRQTAFFTDAVVGESLGIL